jgi:pseudouridine synthase
MNCGKWADLVLRLQKYLAECGVASRRASERLIEQGRVSVNGEAAIIGAQVDPEHDSILVDGKPIGQDDKVYIVLNKPEGTVTTSRDTHGRKTVLHWVKGVGARVFPVGRLDMDVEGVLLLTNDGELAHRLLHPAYEIGKVYLAWVSGQVRPETVRKLEQGVMLDDGMTAPAKAVILNEGPHATRIQLTLHEGRKREVKRMCSAVGHPVRSLHRVAFGNVRSGGLRPGEWRYLSDQEITQLRKLAKL